MVTTRLKSLVAIVAAVAALAVSASASAATKTRAICFPWNVYCHTYVDAWTPVYPSPSRNWTNPIVWEPAPTRVDMHCWLDSQGERWFYVQEYRQGSWGWVQSWHTHNQIATPHC